MGRQKINSITCVNCGKDFDVNTEDIEWTKLDDMGVCSTNPKTKQSGLLQEVDCPFCGKANRIAFEQHTLSNGDVIFMKIRSLEL